MTIFHNFRVLGPSEDHISTYILYLTKLQNTEIMLCDFEIRG